MSVFRNFERLEVIAPNFKRRLFGVTSTIVQLIPEQRKSGLEIAVIGAGILAITTNAVASNTRSIWAKPRHLIKALKTAR